uniref:Putative myc-type, basic helix-loop-helix (BHLH) domain-containing protein n=1 Tax=Helianthus annuus TaxID=4232 RepID=A0A251SWQ3_HELAN
MIAAAVKNDTMNLSLAVVEHICADLCDVRSVRHSFRAAIHEVGPRIKHFLGRSKSCSKAENKACRERQRREILNNRFLELSSTLEPDRPATTD